MSHNLLLSVDKCEILPSINSDHSVVEITLKSFELPRGKGFWKFNNSLLYDKKYVETIKETIKSTLNQYEVISNGKTAYSIDDQLLFETVLLMIRGKTIYYSSTKKKIQKKTEIDLENELLTLENHLDSVNNIDEKADILDKINENKLRLDEINNSKIQGMLIRSKAKWIEKGEKPTKYFLKLETRNFLNKSFTEIEKPDGSKLTNNESIIKEVRNYYEKLYKAENVADINLNQICQNYDIPKLNENKKFSLEGKLTLPELSTALKRMKNDKSPGPDGFTSEFYKFFWKDIGMLLLNSLNAGFEKGTLSISQKQGLITCIPKGNKPKKLLKNWRPISLLNCSYKIGSAAIANRIKSILPLIIHENQKGFVKDRYIGEITRLVYDIMEHTETFQIPGILLPIDFEKAFDSIDRNYLCNVLKFFNFGDNLINWILTFYEDIESRVLVKGFPSTPFRIERGCRQGDPVAPYLFILSVEILGILIRNNVKIKGIKLGNVEYLLSQFADDTSMTLDGSEKCLYAVLETLSPLHGSLVLRLT